MKWSSLAEKVHQSIGRTALLNENDRILLAVSGGMDSVVMFHVFLELQSRWGWELTVGHIDHGLRPGEDEKESGFCRELAEKHNIPYLEAKADLRSTEASLDYSQKSTQKPSLESLARERRYDILETWMIEEDFDALCTAHHASDQAETVLYRLLTGAGIKGLGGIPLSRGNIKRPFLNITKTEIESYAKEKKLQYYNDPSNLNSNFIRNKIRHEVVPDLIKAGFDHCDRMLAESALSSREADLAIDHYANKEMKKIFLEKEDSFSLKTGEFPSIPEIVKKRILRIIYGMHLRQKKHLSEKQLEQLLFFIERSSPGTEMVLNDIVVAKNRKEIVWGKPEKKKIRESFICKEGRIVFAGSDISFRIEKIVSAKDLKVKDPCIAFFPLSLLGKELIFRSWEYGDRMSLFGSGENKKISDVLKDEKADIINKRYYPVLELDDEIIWLPGIKRSNLFRITGAQKEIIRITCKHGETT